MWVLIISSMATMPILRLIIVIQWVRTKLRTLIRSIIPTKKCSLFRLRCSSKPYLPHGQTREAPGRAPLFDSRQQRRTHEGDDSNRRFHVISSLMYTSPLTGCQILMHRLGRFAARTHGQDDRGCSGNDVSAGEYPALRGPH